jgi:APA family basic amino acid/polyamine antiporter
MVTLHLKRELGLGEAILLGLGSILGTGVFVSLGIAAGVTGPSVLLAILFAGGLACCNALSSAQLAAAHPVSGGTYEYGYRFLNAPMGFLAGWFFLLAKSASAATAALGATGYVLSGLNLPLGIRTQLAALVTIIFTAIVWAGLRRSYQVNTLIVSLTLLALFCFVLGGVIGTGNSDVQELNQSFFKGEAFSDHTSRFLEATALLFVAFTGYGRIATMAEEVKNPAQSIPLAILITLGISTILYLGVAWAAVKVMGTEELYAATLSTGAPLQIAAEQLGIPFLRELIFIGAITAMLGVLLNLILGLSRVYLAMARRGDMPKNLARLNATNQSPTPAILTAGGVILLLVFIGDIKTTWSFSAFTVLLYYAITNAAALKLTTESRLYPRWVSWGGLLGCIGLAFWIDLAVLIVGLSLAVVGLIWHLCFQRIRSTV